MFESNKLLKLMSSYSDYIKEHYDEVDLLEEKMSELYLLLKEEAPKFAKKGAIKDNFIPVVRKLNRIEKQLPNNFILDNNPQYEINYNFSKNDITDQNEEEILGYIVNRARNYLVVNNSINKNLEDVDLGDIDLIGQCHNASMNIKFICETIKVYCKVCTIHPAFYKDYNVYGSGGNHQFCLIKIGDKKYIVDITYSQFFTMRENNFNLIGVPLLGGCKAGIYMTLDETKRKFAEKLMRDGWVEATSENIKLYLDAFAISFRNGLYYEKMGKVIYSTDYTPQQYINFLLKKDSQLNYESIEGLGRQRKLLKDAKMNFNIKG